MDSLPQDQPVPVERRCRNCGTRVALQATTCFMCGRALQSPPSRFPFAWRPDLSTLLIIGLAGVVAWQFLRPEAVDRVAAAPTAVVMPPTLVPPTPTSTPTSTVTPVIPTPVPVVSEPLRHTVQSGETLLLIAARYEVEIEDLASANGLEDALIHPGLSLIIPDHVQEVPTPVPAPAQTWTTDFVYNVQPGDSIIGIAYRFGTSPEEIFFANDLDRDSLLHKGQRLVLPVPHMTDEVLVSSELVPRTNNAIYHSPRLLGPADKALISRRDSVLFRWLSVGILRPNEWYVLRIWTPSVQDEDPPSVWTKATSHRLETSAAPSAGGSREYVWQVTVVRVVAASEPDLPGTPRELESASVTSDLRHFTWQ